MKPYIICHMMSSIDGGLHPSRYTASEQGDRKSWSAAYEQIHEELAGDAWMVGRVTMAEMRKADRRGPASAGTIDRPVHIARQARSHAVAIDRSGKLLFANGDVGGDHVIVLLGTDVPDSHLAQLAADGVSYIVSDAADMPLAPLMDALNEHFGIKRLLLEGGGRVNGSLIAAGLVDELSILVAPALDGDTGTDAIVTCEGGLAGLARLALLSAETLEGGTVHLRYRVAPDRE